MGNQREIVGCFLSVFWLLSFCFLDVKLTGCKVLIISPEVGVDDLHTTEFMKNYFVGFLKIVTKI